MIAFVVLQAKQQASVKTMAATMEAPSALSTSQSCPTEAARKTAFSEDLTPELVSIKESLTAGSKADSPLPSAPL